MIPTPPARDFTHPRSAAIASVQFKAVNAKRISAKVPFPVVLEKNQVYNRLAIETVGYYAWLMMFARSKYERIENLLDYAGWCVVGVGVPLLLDSVFRKSYTGRLVQQFKHVLPAAKNAKLSILEIPFELLAEASHTFKKMDVEEMTKFAEEMGFKSLDELKQTLQQQPKLTRKLRFGKVLILFIDLLFMALKGQGFNWGSKWLTEKLSGKKGFSGEFNYASEAYLKEKSKQHEANKKKKFILSGALSLTGVLLPSILLWRALKSPARFGVGLMGKIKNLLPKFNYVDAIFMSKYLILVHNGFNFAAPSLLSARDSHEFREKLNKVLAFDMFYFFGDALLTGWAAKYYEKHFKAKLKGVSLLAEEKKFGPLSIPVAKRLHKIYKQVGNDHWAYRYALRSFLFGLAGTTLLLGVATNLVNNWYTRKQVLKEQAAMKPKPVTASPLVIPPKRLPNPPIQHYTLPALPQPLLWEAPNIPVMPKALLLPNHLLQANALRGI